MKKSLVYTKTGDKGQTGLIGGTRISKDHIRLEAYGTIDELSSNIGMIWAYDIDEHTQLMLHNIQRQLFVIGASLATDDNAKEMKNKLKGNPKDIELLEMEMDKIENDLPPLTNFVLPGGHPTVAACHICRTVARRAERRIVQLSQQCAVDEWVVVYINRLSDYFFVLSRYLSKKFNVTEIPWQPKL